MNIKLKAAVILSAAAVLASCNKEDEKQCPAGTGGNTTLVLLPKHHSKSVRPYAAWVKFNTLNSPGSSASDYDLVVPADTTEDHVHLSNMKCGSYYIYITGYDTGIREAVRGGIPFILPDTSATTISLDIPVTE